jgi:hypothetical protein
MSPTSRIRSARVTKNNDKYDENIGSIGLQGKLLMNKILKMSIKYFEYLQ